MNDRPKPRPTVSVIVPTSGDRASRLELALASIYAQEGLGQLFDVEPIVVDDGSPVPTEDVVWRFPGTRYVRLEKRRGAAGARNAGLREAKGKYIAFLDDDDLWLRSRLFPQVGVLESVAGVEVAYSPYLRVDPTSAVVIPAGDGPSGSILETLVTDDMPAWPVWTGTILVPKVAFDEVGGFDETLSSGAGPEDKDMWLRLASRFRFRFVPGAPGAVYLRSVTGRDWDQRHLDELQRWVRARKQMVFAFLRGAPREAEIRELFLLRTQLQEASLLGLRGLLGEMEQALSGVVADVPAIVAYPWARSQFKERIRALALASDRPLEAIGSLCEHVKQTASRESMVRRLRLRGLVAEAWTEVALSYASGGRRNDRTAGSAATRAILQNPLAPLLRPGLIRLVGRAIRRSNHRLEGLPK